MAYQLVTALSHSVPGIGVFGAVVGGSAALAKNLRARETNDMSNEEIVVDTAKEAAGAGVATALSAAAVGVVGGGLVVSLATAFTVAAAGKYAWDRGLERFSDMDSEA
ncbi:magnetosome protein MamC [Magnetovibrio sp. PR-2]|uniref:magnetosome protein MamC n=1 Tax=Magnetovibrio sp. PR-2 TaxID=3120356 RepID=UPI002FCE54CD